MSAARLVMVIALLLMVAVLAIGGLQVAQAQPQTAVYFDSGGDRLVVASGGEIQLESGSTLDIQAGNSMTVAGDWILAQQSETVTGSFSITPESPYIVLSSSLAITSSTTAPITTTGMTAGQMVILRNGNASDAIIIDGTGGTVECKANVTLGASDTLTLIFNGTDWNCVSSYDNS